jgi:hypothetical protein
MPSNRDSDSLVFDIFDQHLNNRGRDINFDEREHEVYDEGEGPKSWTKRSLFR